VKLLFEEESSGREFVLALAFYSVLAVQLQHILLLEPGKRQV
jgi:hypothetical protein